MGRAFRQVDVFGSEAYRGNPVAVVLDGEGLTTEQMQSFASWTNLSETTFVLPPTRPEAHYRVRIFTPSTELPFAGHPTLGTCHAWLAENDCDDEVVVQECDAGLVPVRRSGDRLAFRAPPLVRSGPVDDADLDRIVRVLGLGRDDVVDAAWVDNGPGWVAVLLRDAEAVLAVEAGPLDGYDLGVIGPHPEGAECAIEVRGFFPVGGATAEDPVTGSLNASVAQWLTSTGRLTAPYVAAQGTALGRAGRVHVDADGDDLWVGGATVTCVSGTVEL
jgi:PhzF family phenazine biosynthesis protein